jgi:peptidoglycan/xylan/chitin deacetylase (PgdA/CDA1 family)
MIYKRLPSVGKAAVDRLRYSAGLLPRVPPDLEPGRPAVVISVDFELAWALRYDRGVANPLERAIEAARRTRTHVPLLLDLFDHYKVPATWATVGHLFLERCECRGGRAHPDMIRPSFFENENWRYAHGDWYDDDPCSSWSEAPEWYAPDLIRDILSRPVQHEVACHTFSHIPCNQEHCPPDLLRAELQECQRLASEWDLVLRSFVFPANLAGNLAVLKELGFQNYRFHGYYHLDIPKRDEWGLLRLPGGIFLERPSGFPVKAWVNSLHRCVARAIQTGTLLHLWLHPSCSRENVTQVLPALLDDLVSRREVVPILRMMDLS